MLVFIVLIGLEFQYDWVYFDTYLLFLMEKTRVLY